MTSINNNESIKDVRLFEKIKSEKNVKQAENNNAVLNDGIYQFVADFIDGKMDYKRLIESAKKIGIAEEQVKYVLNLEAIKRNAGLMLEQSKCPTEMKDIILKSLDDPCIDNLTEALDKYSELDSTDAATKEKAKNCVSKMKKLKKLVSDGKVKEAEALAKSIEKEINDLGLIGTGNEPGGPETGPLHWFLHIMFHSLPCGPATEGTACTMSNCGCSFRGFTDPGPLPPGIQYQCWNLDPHNENCYG